MEEVTIELAQITNFIGLLLKDVAVLCHEGLDEELLVQFVQKAQSLGQHSEEGLVNALHHAALQHHVDEFALVALGYAHLQDLVDTFLVINSRLDS